MKAIVLTYDRYQPFTRHMMATYQSVWPSHPFTFRIPYQHYPQQLKDDFGSRVELVNTPADIKQTVLGLLADLPDDEWVYWCIDDKYLVGINEEAANGCFEWVKSLKDNTICGVMFCRCRMLLDPANLHVENTLSNPYGDRFIQRKNYYQIWIPQFMRVKILREMFLGFPDQPFNAKAMDSFTGQMPGMEVKRFQADQKMYVSADNHARFGESTEAGFITQNCLESMAAHGLSSAGFETRNKEILMGEL